ncbi:DgyrCDS13802 [Dimorphilus gyrociliatus]|uniref:DgyrCDS13802 n=1 Tax=Dimorphilus gyrociliatus TaxID=2664684 RepID=A0A7I8WBS2_9ANNE|nr:DgyrCDS13802 [Dimorphilus gyrociliatus]
MLIKLTLTVLTVVRISVTDVIPKPCDLKWAEGVWLGADNNNELQIRDNHLTLYGFDWKCEKEWEGKNLFQSRNVHGSNTTTDYLICIQLKKLNKNKLFYGMTTKTKSNTFLTVEAGHEKPLDYTCNDKIDVINFYIYTRKETKLDRSTCPLPLREHWSIESPCKGKLEVCLDIYTVEINPDKSCKEENLKQSLQLYCLYSVNYGGYNYTIVANSNYKPEEGKPQFYCMQSKRTNGKNSTELKIAKIENPKKYYCEMFPDPENVDYHINAKLEKECYEDITAQKGRTTGNAVVLKSNCGLFILLAMFINLY